MEAGDVVDEFMEYLIDRLIRFGGDTKNPVLVKQGEILSEILYRQTYVLRLIETTLEIEIFSWHLALY